MAGEKHATNHATTVRDTQRLTRHAGDGMSAHETRGGGMPPTMSVAEGPVASGDHRDAAAGRGCDRPAPETG